MCWGFDIVPANLPVVYWSHDLTEIQSHIQLKLSWWQAQFLQQHQVFSIILSSAFGGDEDEEEKFVPKSKADAQMKLAALFGGGS